MMNARGTKKSVEIVQFFNGEERGVKRTAHTASGARRAIHACASGAGWSVRLRGTKAALEAIGAFGRDGIGTFFRSQLEPERFVDCIVTDAEAKSDPTPWADGTIDDGAEDAPPAVIVWVGHYRDKRAVLPDGRILRVWWADPGWKCSIGEKKAAPRGVAYAFQWEAQAAVLKEAGVET